MITYTSGKWGILFAFAQCGRSIGKGFVISVPFSLLALLIFLLIDQHGDDVRYVMSGYITPLGFLIVFRTTIAFGRYWEGITLISNARGLLFNAFSGIVSFTTIDPSKKNDKEAFLHELVRLMSILFASCLHRVSSSEHMLLEIIDHAGVDSNVLSWMADKPEKCEIILQWMQRLIVANLDKGVITIPAPILSRVFQELGTGIVHINSARRIKDIPFPFPFAQMISVLLIIHAINISIYCGLDSPSALFTYLLPFTTILTLTVIVYNAMEIEMPFGDDVNDLPLAEIVKDMNQGLVTLLDQRAQFAPMFNFDRGEHELMSMRLWGGKDFVSPQSPRKQASPKKSPREGKGAFKDPAGGQRPIRIWMVHRRAGLELGSRSKNLPGTLTSRSNQPELLRVSGRLCDPRALQRRGLTPPKKWLAQKSWRNQSR